MRVYNLPLRVPYSEGKVGFYKNLDNPYPKNSMRFKEWERGFNAAYFKNLEKLSEQKT